MTLHDLTTLARDLARYNSGVLRARAAYAGTLTVTTRRPCPQCGTDLPPRRQLCDDCRDKNRRERAHQEYLNRRNR